MRLQFASHFASIFETVRWLDLFLVPCFGAVIIYFFSQGQRQPAVLTHALVIAKLPVNILFDALWNFSIAGIVLNAFNIRTSMKQAWMMFISHFGVLICVGIALAGLWQLLSIGLSVSATLLLSNFDFTALAALDYVSPYLSFPKNDVYSVANTLLSAIWRAYSLSIFVIAFAKYGGEHKS